MITFNLSQLAYRAYTKAPLSPYGASVNEDKPTVEKITDILDIPTSMAFLGPNDILVTEKKYSSSNANY